jgi:hypothetical protein
LKYAPPDFQQSPAGWSFRTLSLFQRFSSKMHLASYKLLVCCLCKGDACESDGIEFELREMDQDQLEAALKEANNDDSIHGIIVYYPVFGMKSLLFMFVFTK